MAERTPHTPYFDMNDPLRRVRPFAQNMQQISDYADRLLADQVWYGSRSEEHHLGGRRRILRTMQRSAEYLSADYTAYADIHAQWQEGAGPLQPLFLEREPIRGNRRLRVTEKQLFRRTWLGRIGTQVGARLQVEVDAPQEDFDIPRLRDMQGVSVERPSDIRPYARPDVNLMFEYDADGLLNCVRSQKHAILAGANTIEQAPLVAREIGRVIPMIEEIARWRLMDGAGGAAR